VAFAVESRFGKRRRFACARRRPAIEDALDVAHVTKPVEQSAAAAEGLRDQALALQNLVHRFRLSEQHA
jgi:hypothetical protein